MGRLTGFEGFFAGAKSQVQPGDFIRPSSFGRNCNNHMGRLTGFEPATSGATIQRSNQLSYKRHAQVLYIKSHGKSQSALRGSLVGRKNLGSLG